MNKEKRSASRGIASSGFAAVMTVTLCFCAQAAWSQTSPIVALEPEQAGPDFPLVGEFKGEITEAGGAKRILAAQVVAMGKGTFRAVFFPGGLPGDGWTGTGRAEAAGTRTGTTVALQSAAGQAEAYAASATADEMTGTAPGGGEFRLARVTRASPSLGMAAPAGTTALFNGTGLEAWTNAIMDARKQLRPASDSNWGAYTKKAFGSFSLHLEFRTPFKPEGRGQDRGNSGVVMKTKGWGEVQILDSFGSMPLKDECGGLYNTAGASVMACLAPLTWQTYDIQWTAPVVDAAGKTIQEGRMTVWLNGIRIHKDQAIAGLAAQSALTLQEHGNPVVFRNIWIAEGNDELPFFTQVSIAPRNRPHSPGSGRRTGLGCLGLTCGLMEA
jgi:hypothetical protein